MILIAETIQAEAENGLSSQARLPLASDGYCPVHPRMVGTNVQVSDAYGERVSKGTTLRHVLRVKALRSTWNTCQCHSVWSRIVIRPLESEHRQAMGVAEEGCANMFDLKVVELASVNKSPIERAFEVVSLLLSIDDYFYVKELPVFHKQ